MRVGDVYCNIISAYLDKNYIDNINGNCEYNLTESVRGNI